MMNNPNCAKCEYFKVKIPVNKQGKILYHKSSNARCIKDLWDRQSGLRPVKKKGIVYRFRDTRDMANSKSCRQAKTCSLYKEDNDGLFGILIKLLHDMGIRYETNISNYIK